MTIHEQFLNIKFYILKALTGLIPKIIISPAYIFLFGANLNNEIAGLIFLILADYVTGIMTSFKRGIAITSRKSSRTLAKFFVFILAISCSHALEKTIYGELYFISKIVIAYLAVNEFLSIVENFSYMGYRFPSKLLKRIKDYENKL